MATTKSNYRYVVGYDSPSGKNTWVTISCNTKAKALKKANEVLKRRKHVYLTIDDLQLHKTIFKKNTY